MGLFKVGFNIEDYKDILPSINDYLKDDEVENLNEGDLDKCVWKRDEPKIITPDYIRREVKRVLRTGYWCIIKGMAIWIPPNYYFFLRFFNTGGAAPEFRLNRLMSVYFKIRVRNNPAALGTYTIKSRQIGETTMAMSDVLWEAASGNMDYGMIGMQSKSRDTVIQSCWRTLIMGWNGLPKWLKDALYDDFQNGDKTAETMKFVKQATDTEKGRNVLIAYAASSHNAFDSVNNMRSLVLDEVNKWSISFYATFLNYEKFIATGTSRKGLFNIFSSPADVDTTSNAECYDFWKGSNPEELNERGTTDTRIFAHYASPLTGIEGFYDKWGDADADEIYDFIIKKRKSVPKEYKQSEIRAYPLSLEEMFGSFEGAAVWDNGKGLIERKVYLVGTRFKDEISKEPATVYGNLEWENGVQDSEVVFRQADKTDFDVTDARFCFSHFPRNREQLKNVFYPPQYIENVLGIDPFAKRHVIGKNPSNGAMVNFKFRDLHETGVNKTPTMLYINRPHEEIFWEDCLRAAVFNRSVVQYENLNDKVATHFEKRGYHSWLLPSRGQKRGSMLTGDGPSSSGAFLDEMMGLINGYTNTPAYDGQPYLLDNVWFIHLLNDLIAFNPKDTHSFDSVMAFGQSLFGAAKIMHIKPRRKVDMGMAMREQLLY